MWRFPKLKCNLFQDSVYMSVQVVQVLKFVLEAGRSVDVCQTTMLVNEQWLYSSSDNQKPAVLGVVSPFFISSNGVFALKCLIFYFIFIN